VLHERWTAVDKQTAGDHHQNAQRARYAVLHPVCFVLWLITPGNDLADTISDCMPSAAVISQSSRRRRADVGPMPPTRQCSMFSDLGPLSGCSLALRRK